MGLRRENILIYMEILSSLCGGPLGPTRLAQKCNLNYGRLGTFIDPLKAKELVTAVVVEGEEVLAITEKGYKVYSDWLEIWRRLPELT